MVRTDASSVFAWLTSEKNLRARTYSPGTGYGSLEAAETTAQDVLDFALAKVKAGTAPLIYLTRDAAVVPSVYHVYYTER